MKECLYVNSLSPFYEPQFTTCTNRGASRHQTLPMVKGHPDNLWFPLNLWNSHHRRRKRRKCQLAWRHQKSLDTRVWFPKCSWSLSVTNFSNSHRGRLNLPYLYIIILSFLCVISLFVCPLKNVCYEWLLKNETS